MATVPDPGSGSEGHLRTESLASGSAFVVDSERENDPDGTTYVSRDAVSGRGIARTTIGHDDVDLDADHYAQVEGILGGGLVRLFRSDGVWRLTRYTLPDLQPSATVSVSEEATGTSEAGVAIGDDGGRPLVLSAGRLTSWDPGTMTPLGTPLPLFQTTTDPETLRQLPDFASASSDDAEIAVHGTGPEVTIWNIDQRRPVAVVHTDLPADARSDGMAVDPARRTSDRPAHEKAESPVPAAAGGGARTAVRRRVGTATAGRDGSSCSSSSSSYP